MFSSWFSQSPKSYGRFPTFWGTPMWMSRFGDGHKLFGHEKGKVTKVTKLTMKPPLEKDIARDPYGCVWQGYIFEMTSLWGRKKWWDYRVPNDVDVFGVCKGCEVVIDGCWLPHLHHQTLVLQTCHLVFSLQLRTSWHFFSARFMAGQRLFDVHFGT